MHCSRSAKILLVVLSAASRAVAEPVHDPTLVAPHVMVVNADTNTASAIVLLVNDTKDPIPLFITADDFTYRGEALGSRVKFGIGDAAASKAYVHPEAPLAAGASLLLTVEASGLWHAGETETIIRNFSRQIGSLVAVRREFPFRVAPIDKEAPIRISLEEPAYVVLKNDDASTYDVDWVLTDGLHKASGRIPRFRGNSTAFFTVGGADWLPGISESIFGPKKGHGYLFLSATSPDPRRTTPWKTVVVPATVETQRWNSLVQSLAGASTLIGLLILGGAASLFVSHWVPNRMTRVDVKEAIEAMTGKLRRLSDAVNSSLRVGLRVERQRLLDRLSSRSVLSPDFAALADDCAAAAGRLNRQADLVERIDLLLRQVNGDWSSIETAGPTALKQARRLLADAQSALEAPEIGETQLASAEALVTQAVSLAAGDASKAAELAEEVSRRVQDIRVALATVADNKVVKEMLAAHPELREAQEEEDAIPGNITLARLANLDLATARLVVLLSAVSLEGRLSDERLQETDADRASLLRLLRLSTYGAYFEAERLLRELEEDITKGDLREVLANGRNVRVDLEPRRPKVNQSVRMRVALVIPGYSSASARRRIKCMWTFSDGLHEIGWSISHYFSSPGEAFATARFFDESGEQIMKEDGSALSLTEHLVVAGAKRRPVGERTKIEMTRLAVILIATVLGLFAGARDQIAKLDLVPAIVAVFLLGFSADQIKNLLITRPK